MNTSTYSPDSNKWEAPSVGQKFGTTLNSNSILGNIRFQLLKNNIFSMKTSSAT